MVDIVGTGRIDSTRASGTNPVTERRLPGIRLNIAVSGQPHRSPISRTSVSTPLGAVGLRVDKPVTIFTRVW